MNMDDTIAIIISLLSSTNSSYSVCNLNKDFKNETGISIPLFGYSNIGDFLSSIPETVKVSGIYPIQQVSLVTSQKSAHIASLVKRQKTNTGRNNRKRFCPKSKFFVRKPGIDTSFRSEDIQRTEIISEKKNFLDFKEQKKDFKSKRFSNIKKVKEVPSMHLGLAPSLNSSKELIPLKCYYCTEEVIPSIDMKFHAQVGEYIEVCPCQIFNPHKFYFHLRKYKKKFENMFEKLQIFYSTHEIPTVTKELVKPKLACAVFYKIFATPEWHRVEIEKIVSDSWVIVNFIDWGNTKKISIANLKLLHRNFKSLPKQAIRGALANIKPLEGESQWSLRAIKKFCDLAFQKPLVAGVVEVDSKACCLKMALSCTKNREIHINDTLVKEGHAEFDTNVLENHSTNILKTTNLWGKAMENCDSRKSMINNNNNKYKYNNKINNNNSSSSSNNNNNNNSNNNNQNKIRNNSSSRNHNYNTTATTAITTNNNNNNNNNSNNNNQNKNRNNSSSSNHNYNTAATTAITTNNNNNNSNNNNNNNNSNSNSNNNNQNKIRNNSSSSNHNYNTTATTAITTNNNNSSSSSNNNNNNSSSNNNNNNNNNNNIEGLTTSCLNAVQNSISTNFWTPIYFPNDNNNNNNIRLRKMFSLVKK